MKQLIIFTLLLMQGLVHAQSNYYWVFLKDKAGSEFDPFTYFDPHTIERRIQAGIPLSEESDYPVSEEYLTILENYSDTITGHTRWFNAVCLATDNPSAISALPFVLSVEPVFISTFICEEDDSLELDEEDSELLSRQTRALDMNAFHQAGFKGKGLRIAVFDGGFPGVDTNPIFDHIRKRNGILKTWDFTRDKEHVYAFSSHGTAVLSCIGGIIDGTPVGLATEAEFLLARTEVNAEPYSEEKNWLAAVEWADKNGADIINSSLGYTYHRYFPWNMDGKKSLVSKAANMAASKGMLVVNALGNEGDNSWRTIITPADADSVLSVGGTDPYTGYKIGFSSYGPSTDLRMKPNVSAPGQVLAADPKGTVIIYGTSFSSPLVAGFAACAWQTNRKLTNMQLFSEIEKSASLYPYYDYVHGYGIPQASWFTEKTKTESEPTVEAVFNNGVIVLNLLIDDTAKIPMDSYLYYHLANAKGQLIKYVVISVFQKNDIATIYPEEYPDAVTLRVHYNGYTLETAINKTK